MSLLPLPRVAVIHGGPGAAGAMAPVAQRISELCAVLEPYQTALSLQGQIDELASILTHSAQPPVTLIGYSWGAWLSLLTAAHAPYIVSRLILIGCPPFDESAAAGINSTRLSRLTESERAEFTAAFAGLNDPAHADHDQFLATLGRLATKADSCDLLENSAPPIKANAEIYARVWPEAAALRASGELLRRVGMVACPVLSIHGDCDSSPPGPNGSPSKCRASPARSSQRTPRSCRAASSAP